MPEVDLFATLDTVVLRVHDVDAAKAWYQAKLGLEVSSEDMGERLVTFELRGGTSLTLLELKRGESLLETLGVVGSFPVFAVRDARHAWEVLREREVLVDPLRDAGPVLSFEFRDLDGNKLEVRETA